MIAPGLIISLAFSFGTKNWDILRRYNLQAIEGFARVSVVGLLVLLLSQNLLLGLRTEYDFNSGILNGMKSRSYSAYVAEGQMSRSWALNLQQSLTLLSQESVKGDVHLFCKEGLFSAANGSYLPADAYYVNWGPIPSNRTPTTYQFYCGISNEQLEKLIERGLRIVNITSFPSSPISSSGEQFYVLLRKQK